MRYWVKGNAVDNMLVLKNYLTAVLGEPVGGAERACRHEVPIPEVSFQFANVG